jgi:hypothetical protein
MSADSPSQGKPADTMSAGTQSKRSMRLKFAVGYLALTQPAVALVFYPSLRAELPPEQIASADIFFALIFSLFAWVLYGAWMHRRWARYPLLVLLVICFVQGLGDVLSLDWGGLIFLSFAAADKIAFDELQKASGLKLPRLLAWLS